MATQDFPFEFDSPLTLVLRPFGVSPKRAIVRVGEERLQVLYGLFSVDTPLSNVRDATITGPFRFYKALGPRLSVVDRGTTYGTTAKGGVCISFREPVKAMPPVSSPALTVTVADREGLVAALQPYIS